MAATVKQRMQRKNWTPEQEAAKERREDLKYAKQKVQDARFQVERYKDYTDGSLVSSQAKLVRAEAVLANLLAHRAKYFGL